MSRREWTTKELMAVAAKLAAMGFETPAKLAERGYPSLAALALRRERAERAEACASAGR